MVLGYRITPFAAIDLLMVKDVISMLDVYFSKVQQVLLVVAAVAVMTVQAAPVMPAGEAGKSAQSGCTVDGTPAVE